MSSTNDPDQLPPELQQLHQLLKADLETMVGAVADQFEHQAEQLDELRGDIAGVRATVQDAKASIDRIDNAITSTVDQVADHEGRLRTIEQAT